MLAGATTSEMAAYAKAGALAEEILANIRTVLAYGGDLLEVERLVNGSVHQPSEQQVIRNHHH